MRILAVVLVALLTACGSKGKLREPAELKAIDARVQPSVLWDAEPGSGTKRAQGGLRLQVEADALFGADAEGRVFALDPADGRRIWTKKTGLRLAAGPTVAFDLVLLGTLDGEVLALQRADGAERWRAQVSSEVLAAPVTDGQVVAVRTVDGKVSGLDVDTGKRRWVFDRAVPPLTLRGLSTPLLLQEVVMVGLDNGRIAAIRMADGQPVWEEVIAVPTGRSELERITDIDADLVVGGGHLYVASYGGEVAAINLEGGQLRWRRSIRSYMGLALTDDLVVVTDDDGVVWGLDAQTGAAAWKQEGLRNRFVSKPVVHEGYIAVTDFEGYVHWLSPTDGSFVGRHRVSRFFGDGRGSPAGHGASPGFATPPTVHDGRLYLTTADGRIVVLSAAPAA